jgi:hypothetical protein
VEVAGGRRQVEGRGHTVSLLGPRMLLLIGLVLPVGSRHDDGVWRRTPMKTLLVIGGQYRRGKGRTRLKYLVIFTLRELELFVAGGRPAALSPAGVSLQGSRRRLI